MKISNFFIPLLFAISGCSLSTYDKAIIASNEVRTIAEAQQELISGYCVPKYQAAKTQQDISDVDKLCLPAKTSFYAVKAAWISLSAILEAAKYNQASEQEIQKAELNLLSAINNLNKSIQELK